MMRSLAIPVATLLAFSLACAAGDAHDSGAVTDDSDPTGNTSVDHPNCDAYVACISDVAPEATASAVESYGTSSECWADSDEAALCEAACAEATHDMHLAYPASDACDDGTAVPSASVLVVADWYLDAIEAEGDVCDTPESVSFLLSFDPSDTTEFEGEIKSQYGFTWNSVMSCANEGQDIACEYTDGDYGYFGTVAVRVSDDLLSMAGDIVVENEYEGATYSCDYTVASD